MKFLRYSELTEEKKRLLESFLKSNSPIGHKYLGEVRLVSLSEESFVAKSKTHTLPFHYDDIDAMFDFIQKKRTNNEAKTVQPIVYDRRPNDKVYNEEIAYLEKVENVLEEVIFKYKNKIKETREELRYSGSSYEDIMSKSLYLDEIACKESIIDNYNLMKPQPYFAHMEFVINEKDTEIVYIGNRGLIENNMQFVVDWRTPVGQTYYQQKIPSTFSINNYNWELHLKRALRISAAQIVDINTIYDKRELQKKNIGDVVDPFLLKVIDEKRHIPKLTDIIQTIQSNQIDIIQRPLKEEFIVQGCAGSGKTMVLLHRLSYLKYQYPNIQWNNVKIITPNVFFDEFIKEVSEVLELHQIQCISIEKYYLDLISRYGIKPNCEVSTDARLNSDMLASLYSNEFVETCKKRSEEYFVALKNEFKLQKFEETLGPLNSSIRKLDEAVFPADYFERISTSHKSIYSMFVQKQEEYNRALSELASFKGRLEEIDKKKDEIDKKEEEYNSMGLFRFRAKQKTEKEINALKKERNALKEEIEPSKNGLRDSQGKSIGEQLEIREKNCRELAKKLPTKEQKAALTEYGKIIESLTFKLFTEETITHNVNQIYERFNFKNSRIMFKHKLFLSLLSAYCYYGPIKIPDTWLNIDEAQDIGCSEYQLFRAVLGDRCCFNLYGDVNQLIYSYKGISDWEQISSVLKAKTYYLNENFRNTLQIAEYCNSQFDFKITPIGGYL